MLVNWFSVSGAAEPGVLPPAVRYAFYIGSACLLLSVFWTAASTHERPAAVARATEREPDRPVDAPVDRGRSEEHTSELQSLMRISYAVFCLKKKKYNNETLHLTNTS